MSTQSINEISRERHLFEAEDKLKKFSDKLFLNSHFKVGQEPNLDEVEYYMFVHRAYCTDSCEFQGFIQRKLEGLLECPKKTKNRRNLQDLIEQYALRYNKTEEEVIETIMTWENTEW